MASYNAVPEKDVIPGGIAATGVLPIPKHILQVCMKLKFDSMTVPSTKDVYKHDCFQHAPWLFHTVHRC